MSEEFFPVINSSKIFMLYFSLQLQDLIVQLLENQRLKHGEVKIYGTPRRLVVCSHRYL